MSETPVVPPTPRQRSADPDGALRVVAILVMIASILGLLGSGFCFLAFFADGFYDEMIGVLMVAGPILLFFAGSIWVCKALLDRLKK